MSSSGTPTPNYKLNQWQANDKPERMDFNSDNQKIDATLSNKAHLYVSFEALSLTESTATIDEIVNSMQTGSILMAPCANAAYANGVVPATNGFLRVTFRAKTYVMFEYEMQGGLWSGYYNSASTIGAWSGWREVSHTESGMWQPTFHGATVAGNMQVEVTYKDYYKNGKIVSCSLLFKVKASGGATGDLIIGALPVPMASGGFVADFYAMPAAFAGAKLAAITNGTTSQLIIRSGTQTVKADNAALVSDSPWCINFTYRGA